MVGKKRPRLCCGGLLGALVRRRKSTREMLISGMVRRAHGSQKKAVGIKRR